jgi:hypothetical protein
MLGSSSFVDRRASGGLGSAGASAGALPDDKDLERINREALNESLRVLAQIAPGQLPVPVPLGADPASLSPGSGSGGGSGADTVVSKRRVVMNKEMAVGVDGELDAEVRDDPVSFTPLHRQQPPRRAAGAPSTAGKALGPAAAASGASAAPDRHGSFTADDDLAAAAAAATAAALGQLVRPAGTGPAAPSPKVEGGAGSAARASGANATSKAPVTAGAGAGAGTAAVGLHNTADSLNSGSPGVTLLGRAAPLYSTPAFSATDHDGPPLLPASLTQRSEAVARYLTTNRHAHAASGIVAHSPAWIRTCWFCRITLPHAHMVFLSPCVCVANDQRTTASRWRWAGPASRWVAGRTTTVGTARATAAEQAAATGTTCSKSVVVVVVVAAVSATAMAQAAAALEVEVQSTATVATGRLNGR